MAPFDTLLQQVRNKLSSTANTIFNATPVGQAYNATQIAVPKIQQGIQNFATQRPNLAGSMLKAEPLYNKFQSGVNTALNYRVQMPGIQQIQNPVLKNVANIGSQIALAPINAPIQALQGAYKFPQAKTKKEAIGSAAQIVSAAMSDPRAFLSTAGKVIDQPRFLTDSQKLLSSIKEGASTGAQIGAFGGGLTGLESGAKINSPEEYVKNFLSQAGTGLVAGGVLGGAVGGLGSMIKITNDKIQGQARSEAKLMTKTILTGDPKGRPPWTKGLNAQQIEDKLYSIRKDQIKQRGVIDLSAEIGTAKTKLKQPINVPEQPRGFTESVQQAPNVPKRVKGMVQNVYTSKPNTKLMGEAQALLQEGAKIDLKNTPNIDQKIVATMKEALNNQRKNPELAANLYNNLSEAGTELGRGVQAYSLLQKMSPDAIALSAAGKIKAYNRTAVRKIPELSGEQVSLIAKKVDALKKLTVGSREHNIAVNELSNTINQFIPSSIADKAITVWKAGLLTSLRTTERNILGNTIHGLAETVKDLPATTADMLMSMATGKRTITPTTRGVGEAFSKKTGQQISDILKLGYDASDDITKFDHKSINWGNNPIERALKTYTDVVFRSLGAQDKPFYNAAFKRSLFSQAGAEAINAGRAGDRSFIQSMVNTPTENMIKTAISDANVATFKDKNSASAIANAVKREMEKVKIGQFELGKIASEVTMPFTGVPSSILGQIINYSPIGLLKGIVDTGKVVATQVPDLQRQAAQEIGRGVIGSGIFGLGAYLASKGLITGQPKDAEEQRQWDLENKPRNSIMVGGKWRSLNSIGPESVVFLAGSKLNEELKQGGSVGSFGGKLAKDYLDQSFVQGLQQPVNVITDPARYGKSYGGGLVSSVVPNIVKDTAKALDTSQRESNTIMDYAKSAIPGKYGRESLIEKRDVLGNVMKQEPTGISAFIDLFNSKTPVDNQVVNELGRLQQAGTGATPSKMTPQQTILKQKVKLTFDQLNQLEQGVGEIVRPRLQTLISSPVYQQLDDESKAKAIDSIVKDARLKYKNINAKMLTGAGLDPNQYLDINGNLKTISTEPIPEPKLTGNKTIDDKLKASYKIAVTNQQMEQYKMATQGAPTQKKTYDYIDENGNYKTVDLTPVKYPTLTGNQVIDKRLKSAYTSEINSQINDVIKLGQSGQITQKEMIDMVNSLTAQTAKTKGVAKARFPTARKIKGVGKVSFKKAKGFKIPKLAKIKALKPKKLKQVKLARFNIKPLLKGG